MYDTVIFDLDGTLLDTLDDLTGAVNESLRRAGYPPRDRMEVRAFIGNGLRNLLRLSAPEPIPEERFAPMFEDFRRYYTANCRLLTRPYPGILPLIAALRRRGIRLAIVSNKNDAAVKSLAAFYFPEGISAAIGETDGVRRKPAPDTVDRARAQLGARRADCLYVGDSEVDAETAKNAGIDCALVDWGFRDRSVLEPLGARAVLHEPEELLTFLDAAHA